MKSVLDKILGYNAKRNKNFVHLKYNALAESPHRFFRGTNHLFIERLVKETVLKNVPFTWICGDLHLENFGSYKGNSSLVYFDINDFDEAAIAPCTIDLVKLCTSIFLVGQELNFSEKESLSICHSFIESYKNEILTGHAARLENATAKGIIKTFFDKVEKRKSKIFLKDRIYEQNKKIYIKTDFRKYYPLATSEKQLLKKALYKWVEENKHDKNLYTFIDAAFRIAGTGSLGLNRYCVLVKENKNSNYILLDIKQADKIILEKLYPSKQIKYKSEAHRVVHAQKRMNDTAPAGFTTIRIGNEYYIFKKHRPQEDKFTLISFKNEKVDFIKLVNQLGHLLAWAQLRSSGLDNTVNGDGLIKFVNTSKLEEIIPCAKKMYKHVLADYKSYLHDYTTIKQPKK
jgi:uncharacterized protein (DUF2252 family)